MLSVFSASLPRLTAISCLVVLLNACDSGSETTHSGEHGPSSSNSSASSAPTGLTLGECQGTDASVCGNFDGLPGEDETTELPLPPGWSLNIVGEGSVSMTSEQVFSGDRSVKVVSAGGDNRAFLTLDLNYSPPLKQEMFGSMWLYLAEDSDNDTVNSGDFTFLQAEGSAQPASGAPTSTNVMYRGRVDGDQEYIFTHYDTFFQPSANSGNEWETDCRKQPPLPPPERYVLPKNEWFCVQWHIKQSNNHIDFTINEQILTSIRVFGTGHTCEHTTQSGIWYAPQTFERIHLGIEQYAADATPRTLYIDDIHLDAQLVACDGSLSDPSHH